MKTIRVLLRDSKRILNKYLWKTNLMLLKSGMMVVTTVSSCCEGWHATEGLRTVPMMLRHCKC